MEKRYIFDADTHVSPYSNFDKSINACQWEERMERAGVAHAIVWLLPQGVVDVTERIPSAFYCFLHRML